MELVCKYDLRYIGIVCTGELPKKNDLVRAKAGRYVDGSLWLELEGFEGIEFNVAAFEYIPFAIHNEIQEALSAPAPKKENIVFLFVKEYYKIIGWILYGAWLLSLIIRQCLK